MTDYSRFTEDKQTRQEWPFPVSSRKNAMTTREAMQQALEALEECEAWAAVVDAKDALRARLAQPEAEPVMEFYATAHNGVPEVGWSWLVDPTTLPAGTRLYTASQPAAPSATATAERALDNCRRYAAKHRNELWAQGILRLCADAGCVASPLREAPQPAVPELLEALREAELVLAEKLSRLGADPAVSPTTHRIRAAIAKATGEAA